MLREPRLAPLGGRAPRRVERDRPPLEHVDQAVPDRIEVVEHHAVVNHERRLRDLVVRVPEAAVRVAVLRTDPRMEDERPGRRQRKDLLAEQALATGQREVGTEPADESRRLGAVRTGGREHGGLWAERRVRGAQPLERAGLPGAVLRGEEQPLEQSKGEHVEEAEGPDATDLALDAQPQAPRGLTDLDDADQVREGAQPTRHADPVERLVVVADEQRLHQPPRRNTMTGTVRSMIFRSANADWYRTYSRSNASLRRTSSTERS